VTLVARVTRKTRDLVLDSAEELLRSEVPRLAAVRRAEVWTFDVEDEAAAAEVRRLLDETTLVANPNVHRWTIDAAEDAPGPHVTVRVTERVDAKGSAVLRGLRRCGARGVRGVTRAVEWILDLPEAAAGEAESVAAAVAPILGNPHAQDVVTRTSGGER